MEHPKLNYPDLDTSHPGQSVLEGSQIKQEWSFISYPQLDQEQTNWEQKDAAKEEAKAEV
jgi:hypothetical protein